MTSGPASANRVSSRPSSAPRPTNESAARKSSRAFRRAPIPNPSSRILTTSEHGEGTTAAAVPPGSRLRGFAGQQCLHVCCRKRLTAHGPVAALNLVDHHPGDRAHVLALDAHHGVGDALDDGALLALREDAFDDLHIDQWHWISPFSTRVVEL